MLVLSVNAVTSTTFTTCRVGHCRAYYPNESFIMKQPMGTAAMVVMPPYDGHPDRSRVDC